MLLLTLSVLDLRLIFILESTRSQEFIIILRVGDEAMERYSDDAGTRNVDGEYGEFS